VVIAAPGARQDRQRKWVEKQPGREILLSGMTAKLLVHNFSRTNVERGDFSQFTNLYAPSKLPTGADLRAMMNRFIFLIDGYNEDSREINAIPQVRQFYQAFHQAWPYWLYFCNLDSEAFRLNVFCCLSSVSVLKVDGQPNFATNYDRIELLRFVEKDFGPLDEMCGRAEMSLRQRHDRRKAVFEYFGTPFKTEPPP
jgi:hypothetical protein